MKLEIKIILLLKTNDELNSGICPKHFTKHCLQFLKRVIIRVVDTTNTISFKSMGPKKMNYSHYEGIQKLFTKYSGHNVILT